MSGVNGGVGDHSKDVTLLLGSHNSFQVRPTFLFYPQKNTVHKSEKKPIKSKNLQNLEELKKDEVTNQINKNKKKIETDGSISGENIPNIYYERGISYKELKIVSYVDEISIINCAILVKEHKYEVAKGKLPNMRLIIVDSNGLLSHYKVHSEIRVDLIGVGEQDKQGVQKKNFVELKNGAGIGIESEVGKSGKRMLKTEE